MISFFSDPDYNTKARLPLGISETDFLKIKMTIIPGTSTAIPEYFENDGKSG